MHVLCLSGYDALSHRSWRETLAAAFPEHRFTTLAAPPRHFAFRLRAQPLLWAPALRDRVARNPPDLVLATSVVDGATLRGLVPALAAVPWLVYFHENQFAYPRRPERARDPAPLDGPLVNLSAALCADRVLFNSAWNRDSFLAGVVDLLRRLPERIPTIHTETLEQRAAVLPVPLPDACFDAGPDSGAREPGGPLELLWNHRFEWDKGPDRLLAVLRALDRAGLEARVHVVGPTFRTAPPAFAEIAALLRSSATLRAGARGWQPEPDYRTLLRRAHVVLSTTRHDFQGLSVLEAVAAGCAPVVPDALCYREQYPAPCRYPVTEEGTAVLRAVERIEHLAERWKDGVELPVPDVRAWSLAALRPAWEEALAGVHGS